MRRYSRGGCERHLIARPRALPRQFRTAFFWVDSTTNWNCACSSGGIVAILSLFGNAGAAPWAWSELLQPLVAGVAPCVGAYNADSSWEDGPAYWDYASKYNVWLFAALQSALGDASAAGLREIVGVSAAERFPLWSTGANALALGASAALPAELFNWADSETSGAWIPFAQW